MVIKFYFEMDQYYWSGSIRSWTHCVSDYVDNFHDLASDWIWGVDSYLPNWNDACWSDCILSLPSHLDSWQKNSQRTRSPKPILSRNSPITSFSFDHISIQYSIGLT